MVELIDLIKSFLLPIWSYIVFFMPIKMIFLREGEVGGRYTFGKSGKKSFKHGLHFATMFQTLDKEWGEGNLLQTGDGVDVFTSDGVAMLIEGAAVYDISNYFLYARKTDAEDVLEEAFLSEIMIAYQKSDIDDALDFTEGFESRILSGLRKKAAHVGVDIRTVLITGRFVKDSAVLRAMSLAPIETQTGEMTVAERVLVIAGAQPVNITTPVEEEEA